MYKLENYVVATLNKHDLFPPVNHMSYDRFDSWMDTYNQCVKIDNQREKQYHNPNPANQKSTFDYSMSTEDFGSWFLFLTFIVLALIGACSIIDRVKGDYKTVHNTVITAPCPENTITVYDTVEVIQKKVVIDTLYKIENL